ncbi:hypothetical protein O9H85_28830 [Paenibacillus filicis]|uniref:Uncharacterized protein n=1 Tax=Paenibacillus gyeongsangnamensis TaxID=3388067 RepID=A0ABT4QHJ1_9BACL|nr:hypothetical protein [Paenibacillus filicis]MCZ8516326.1 hypothetical protein [Paenibacillus filicis]
MSTDGDNKSPAQLTEEILGLIEQFDHNMMTKALAHSHQIITETERLARESGKSDEIKWEFEYVKSNFDEMEQLFKAKAYDKITDRITFINVYNKITVQNKSKD